MRRAQVLHLMQLLKAPRAAAAAKKPVMVFRKPKEPPPALEGGAPDYVDTMVFATGDPAAAGHGALWDTVTTYARGHPVVYVCGGGSSGGAPWDRTAVEGVYAIMRPAVVECVSVGFTETMAPPSLSPDKKRNGFGFELVARLQVDAGAGTHTVSGVRAYVQAHVLPVFDAVFAVQRHRVKPYLPTPAALNAMLDPAAFTFKPAALLGPGDLVPVCPDTTACVLADARLPVVRVDGVGTAQFLQVVTYTAAEAEVAHRLGPFRFTQLLYLGKVPVSLPPKPCTATHPVWQLLATGSPAPAITVTVTEDVLTVNSAAAVLHLLANYMAARVPTNVAVWPNVTWHRGTADAVAVAASGELTVHVSVASVLRLFDCTRALVDAAAAAAFQFCVGHVCVKIGPRGF